MGIKTCLAGLCLAVLAATVVEVPPVEAQTYTAQPDRDINRAQPGETVRAYAGSTSSNPMAEKYSE
jgi:hypothetical protein